VYETAGGVKIVCFGHRVKGQLFKVCKVTDPLQADSNVVDVVMRNEVFYKEGEFPNIGSLEQPEVGVDSEARIKESEFT